MADIAEDLIAFLTADSTIAALVTDANSVVGICHNIVPQEMAFPLVWLRRASRETERTLDAAVGEQPDSVRFDLECYGDDLEEAMDLADAVTARLDNYRGTFGTRTAQGMFVEDASDDYVPRGIMGDESIHFAALSVQIFK